ncbi:MAG: lysoplasmalogenase [Candidatus Cryptobacteroides sp.]
MISEKTAFELVRNNKGIASTVIIFTLLVIMYFFPPSDLKLALPDFFVNYRVAWPLLTLTIASCFLVCWPVAFAMLFSFAGDFLGAYGSFIGQMTCFAIAHGFFIYFFSVRFKSVSDLSSVRMKIASKEDAEIFNNLRLKRIVVFCLSAIVSLIFISIFISFILPYIDKGTIRIGCGVYAGLICIMVGTALLQRDLMFGIGAVLFLISDTILGWNKFVSPIEYSSVCILIPYYSGQLLIWLRACMDNVRRK